MKTKKIVKPKVRKRAKPMSVEDLRKLPRAQQRVLIAKDALKLLDSSKIQPAHMTYMESEASFEPSEAGDDELVIDRLREIWKKKEAWCGVCQIGSLFVGALDTFNSLKLSDIDPSCGEPSMHDMIGYLDRWWDEKDLRVMETAFEGSWQGGEDSMFMRTPSGQIDYNREVPGVGKAMNFASKYNRGEPRMRAILKNIIKNNGRFEP
jgi:hypothetical protein